MKWSKLELNICDRSMSSCLRSTFPICLLLLLTWRGLGSVWKSDFRKTNSFTKILTQFSNPVLPDKSFWFKHPSNLCTFCCSDNLFSFTKSYYTFLLAICYMIMSVKWSFFWLIQCDIPTRSQLYVQWCVIRIRVEITNFKLMKITKISTVSTPYQCDAFFCCI